ncbi:MAG: hypothetical protein N0E44_18000 [Candidatus Thiodiazotropha lotti]|nr:hypothetical protein [Candidatus Thiodiazotropha lotti]MCW4221777.1 hypothetical protein [Candidatus Thiodiazotropha lotti]
MSEKIRVLKKLKRRPKAGITALDFPTGYRLASRIGELRKMGIDIETMQSGKTKLARYRLV